MTNFVKQYLSSKPASLLTICAATTVIGMAAVSPPLTIPISGTFGTTSELKPTDTFGLFQDSIQGVGNVQGLGFCTILVEQHVDFLVDPPAIVDSSWVVTLMDGNQLNLTFSGAGTGATDPAFVQLSGEGTITGGTGRFQNATGQISVNGVVHIDTPPGVFPAEAHATFSMDGLVRLSKK